MIKRRPQKPVDALEAASCKEEDDEDGEGRSVASGPRRRAKSCKLCDAKPSDPTPLDCSSMAPALLTRFALGNQTARPV